MMIIEKALGIPPDYQFKAINSKNHFQSNWHKNKMVIAEKLSSLNKKMRVLDLGTGSGNFELLFSNRVKEIVGIDYNNDALHFLHKQLSKSGVKNVKLLQQDITKIKTNPRVKKFDLIVMIDVIEHLKQKDVKKLFAKFQHLLSNKGKVVMITPNYRSLWPILEYVFDLLALTPKFRGHQHLSKLYQGNLNKLIKSNGLKKEVLCTFNLFSFIFPNERLSKNLCVLESKFPFPIGNLIAVVFSKSDSL